MVVKFWDGKATSEIKFLVTLQLIHRLFLKERNSKDMKKYEDRRINIECKTRQCETFQAEIA